MQTGAMAPSVRAEWGCIQTRSIVAVWRRHHPRNKLSQLSVGRARSGGSNFSSMCPITSLEGKLSWTPQGSVMHYHLPSSSQGSCRSYPSEGGAGQTGKLCILVSTSPGNEWLLSAPWPWTILHWHRRCRPAS